jgi:protein SCO1/2
MMENLHRYLFSILLLAVYSCTSNSTKEVEEIALPYYNTADFTPNWIENDDLDDELHTIEKFSFLNQNGEIVTNESLSGKIYVVDFFFTICPSICPKMTSNLARIQKEFQNDEGIQLISFSVMPWVDSVSVIKNYAEIHQINANQWQLLTGDTEEVYTLARQSFFAEKEIGLNRNTDEFLHTENFILIDGEGHIRGVYNGTIGLEMIRLSQDIRTLKAKG